MTVYICTVMWSLTDCLLEGLYYASIHTIVPYGDYYASVHTMVTIYVVCAGMYYYYNRDSVVWS